MSDTKLESRVWTETVIPTAIMLRFQERTINSSTSLTGLLSRKNYLLYKIPNFERWNHFSGLNSIKNTLQIIQYISATQKGQHKWVCLKQYCFEEWMKWWTSSIHALIQEIQRDSLRQNSCLKMAEISVTHISQLCMFQCCFTIQSEQLNIITLSVSLIIIPTQNALNKIHVVSSGICDTWSRVFILCISY
jgi:hypothetical protein